MCPTTLKVKIIDLNWDFQRAFHQVAWQGNSNSVLGLVAYKEENEKGHESQYGPKAYESQYDVVFRVEPLGQKDLASHPTQP